MKNDRSNVAFTDLTKHHPDAVAVVPDSLISISTCDDLVRLELRFLHMVDRVSKSNSVGIEVEYITVVVVLDVDLQNHSSIPCTFTTWTDSCGVALDVTKRI